ncbi:MAG: bifunctional diaminohydroxyphosphoribosylaminopyrimidine deaminase/5-amino-6-(5-phosphoribosylamino)uracil reductase RibD [Pirellulaceae bacterium]|jgi:diaminohydroxyphosphoribosylaminopyrimidine deaminase/5-amino-6-(5-phosphoribosylamino)uracil reductase|nr:bifunctional diaminohydroxyphosphoribosylaminopyrimidine deaminase/5-amino-6-(5-phosphoribosylamino)uracil reductase RibD [Pirellulaceae bacterium]MDP7018779.1 bifunctional diaminohydroxyphosphoribosylaminopyrimidine deaminase/5-amino-6-(5-phosphoribosylamino)uracil reductase RibD [Pirellulaceae bacterium]
MDNHESLMARALDLAQRGEGAVEPNPMVGCVVARGGEVVGEGWHQQFGGPHAEANAIRAAGSAAENADVYVTLEPCCHQGKTPPCVDSLIAAQVRRVFVAHADPFPQVDGGGIRRLTDVGIEVRTGLLAARAAQLLAPYLRLVESGRPWVIAKWAMTLDGKIATRTGDSRWISNPTSREIVHALRRRVDAILVGVGTVMADDPQLTARPPGSRVATRVVLDDEAVTPGDSVVASTADQTPTLIAVDASRASRDRCDALATLGCEIYAAAGQERRERLVDLCNQLGARRMTNVLVEGGAAALGSFFDARLVDEVHVFVSPRIVGGAAPTPVGGLGCEMIQDALQLSDSEWREVEGDLYLRGRLNSPPPDMS